MKKLKPFLLRLPIYALIVALIGVGGWKFVKENKLPDFVSDAVPTETAGEDPEEINVAEPKTMLAIGDTFKYKYTLGTGHFLCKITGASIIDEASECPPEEQFKTSNPVWADDADGEVTFFTYDEFFTEGGACDRGVRFVKVDLEVTNVDAQCFPYVEGSFSDGLFKDPYLVHYYEFLHVVDLARVNWPNRVAGFNRYDLCLPEDDRATIGIETNAIRVAPGETVSFSYYFWMPVFHGRPTDVGHICAISGVDTNLETGIFIDLDLENGGIE